MSIEDGIDREIRVHRPSPTNNIVREREEVARKKADAQRADALVRIHGDSKKGESPVERQIRELQENVHMAEHRAFAAEVKERRARQRVRNQKKQLKQLHQAINEKNNQIRNLKVGATYDEVWDAVLTASNERTE